MMMNTTQAKQLHKPARLRAFAACRRGSAAPQMAIAMTILLMFVVGTLELGMVMFVQSLAEGGLREAARYGITGQAPTNSNRAAQIASIVSDHTHGLIEVSPSSLKTKIYPSFASIGQPEDFEDGTNGQPANGKYDAGEDYTDTNGNGQWDQDMGVAGEGNAGEVVLYELTFDWDLMTPVLPNLAGIGDKLTLNASIAVRNEPFSNGAP